MGKVKEYAVEQEKKDELNKFLKTMEHLLHKLDREEFIMLYERQNLWAALQEAKIALDK